MPRARRRKVPLILSDDEAGPPTPQQRPEVTDGHCALSDVESEPDVSSTNRKKPRLDSEVDGQ